MNRQWLCNRVSFSQVRCCKTDMCEYRESVMNTFVEYTDPSGRKRTKKTKQFDHRTSLFSVETWISTWWKQDGSCELEIKDPQGKFVDFDDGYIGEYKPFVDSESTNSATQDVELRIINIKDHRQNLAFDNSHEKSVGPCSLMMCGQPQNSTSIAEQSNNGVQQPVVQKLSPLICADHPIIIDETKSGIQFTRNVNDTQRDQYSSDRSRATSSQQKRYFVQIQSEKKDLDQKAKHRQAIPQIKIAESIVPENERSACSLLIFLVHEICQNGKRTFYHHNEREFITTENATSGQLNSSNDDQGLYEIQKKNNSQGKPVVLALTEKMFIGDGEVLNLKTQVIIQTKTRSKVARTLFCELTNKYPDDTIYETTRLACVLQKNGTILWDRLVFSSAMTFPKSTDAMGDIEVKDNNGELIEKIPVQIMKRKQDLNQSDNVIKRPPRVKKTRQNPPQTDSPNTTLNQNQSHVTYVTSHDRVDYGMTTTGAPYQASSMGNQHMQYLNQVDYSMSTTHSSFPNQGLSTQQSMLPSMMNNYRNNFFQNQSTTTDMNSYINQTGTNMQETDIFPPPDSLQSEAIQASNYYDMSRESQQQNSSQASFSLPNMQSFLSHSYMPLPSEETYSPDANNDFIHDNQLHSNI